jgi:hypothetical protein
MAKEREAAETPVLVDANAMAAAIGQAIGAFAPKKEIKEGDPEWVERMRAEGWYDDFFGVTILQNAYEAQARGLSEEVRKRASQLKDGTYIKGRVRVSVEDGGSTIRLSYPVKGDNRLINQQYFSDFSDLVNKIWDEMHVSA